MQIFTSRVSWSLAFVMVVSTSSAALATDQVVPVGTIVDKTNVDKYSQYLSPALVWMVMHGVKMPVSAYKQVDMQPPFKEATEKYSAQVKLGADGSTWSITSRDCRSRRLTRPINGRARSTCSTSRRPSRSTTSTCATSTATPAPSARTASPLRVERHFLIDHFRRLYFTRASRGGPEADDAPTATASRYKEALYPLIEPFDLKGTGFTLQPLPRPHAAGRQLALPAAAPPRAPPVVGAALGRAVRPGHRPGQLRRLRRATSRGWTGSSSARRPCSASIHAENLPVKWGEAVGRLHARRQLGAAQGLDHRRHLRSCRSTRTRSA